MGKDKDKKPKKDSSVKSNNGWVLYHTVKCTKLTFDKEQNLNDTYVYTDYEYACRNNQPGHVYTVKHLNLNVTFQGLDYWSRKAKFLSATAGSLIAMAGDVPLFIREMYNTHTPPIKQIFNDNLLFAKVYMVYLPRSIELKANKIVRFQDRVTTDGKKGKYPELAKDCIVAQHPEWILDVKDFVYGVHAPLTVTLNSPLARNLRHGDGIYIIPVIGFNKLIKFETWAPMLPYTLTVSYSTKC